LNIEQRQFTLMIKSSDNKKIEFFCKKALAKNSESPIIRPTQRRAVVTIKKKPVRRSFLLFNNISDNLCGHLLIDLF